MDSLGRSLVLALDVQALDLADIPRNKLLGNAKRCQTGPEENHKKASNYDGLAAFYAIRCLAVPDAGSFPLDYLLAP